MLNDVTVAVEKAVPNFTKLSFDIHHNLKKGYGSVHIIKGLVTTEYYLPKSNLVLELIDIKNEEIKLTYTKKDGEIIQQEIMPMKTLQERVRKQTEKGRDR